MIEGPLAGKVAIITGGTKGIGLACTWMFAEKGAKVVFTSRNRIEGEMLARDLAEKGFDGLYILCDVINEHEIKSVFAETVEKYGDIHILVNNAATHISKIMDEYTVEDFDVLINTNLRNYFLHAKYAIPHLRKTKGSIVNIGSSTAKVGQYAGSLYAATKGGIVAFTKSIAMDYARVPIRVNAVLPAYVNTPLLQSWIQQQPNPTEAAEGLGRAHALGRISEPREIAAVAAFLASDEASTMTGAIIDADGGATLEYSPAVITFRE